MKLKLIFVMTMLLVITSCSKDDDILEIDTPHQIITDRPAKISASFPKLNSVTLAGIDKNYTFEYDSEGRVLKRNGYISIGNEMYPDSFFNDPYTRISYTGNTATMKNYKTSIIDERNFEFDNQGRIIKLNIPSVTNAAKDKRITYSYNTVGKLTEALTEFPNAAYNPANPNDYILTYVEKITYDNVGNVEKAITTEKHNNVDIYITKVVEFSQYDTAPNPFRKLGVFAEYFYFTLPTNNFNRMVTKMYNSGNLGTTYIGAWNNSYNLDGTVKLFQ
ncbi:hypothetical protein NK356_23305 [Chryseobacterium sp. S0630]|uniref:hypothetical protein n=1 Tax=Chryseobacterium sp. S0630 TaxID=2957803 RepID=UPI00209CD800|nr:hypothetical protein [Chryseobacterium sp. S0630]MCP1302106.1 hypothetical protein [Chryseobacterium sp. S0630]